MIDVSDHVIGMRYLNGFYTTLRHKLLLVDLLYCLDETDQAQSYRKVNGMRR